MTPATSPGTSQSRSCSAKRSVTDLYQQSATPAEIQSQGVNYGSKTNSRGSSHRDALSHLARRSEIIDFLKKAFDAKISHEPLKRPDGTIMHAEVQIGNSRVMLADEGEMAKATQSSLHLYVPNVDHVYQQAVKAGGKTIMEPTDMF